MSRLNEFPDLGRHFQLMKIKDGLLAIQPDGVLAIGIVQCVEDGKLVGIVKEIKEKAKENRELMASVVGDDLLTLIEKI